VGGGGVMAVGGGGGGGGVRCVRCCAQSINIKCGSVNGEKLLLCVGTGYSIWHDRHVKFLFNACFVTGHHVTYRTISRVN